MVETSYTPEQKRELIIRLAQFRCSEPGSKVSDELDKFFIYQALFQKQDQSEGLSIPEIHQSLKKNCILSKLTQSDIERLLPLLIKTKSILKTGNENYILSGDVKQLLIASNTQFEKNRKQFSEFLFNQIISEFKIDKESLTIDETLMLFEDIFSELMFTYGHSVAKHFLSISKSGEYEDKLFQMPDILNIAQKMIEQNKNPEIKKITGSFFQKIIETPETFLEYIKSLSRLFIYIQIKNADPELIKFQKKELEGHTFYLDANIIIALLCEHHPHHSLVKQFLEITKNFNQKLYCTSLTCEEFLNQLDNANKKFEQMKKTHKRLMEFLKDVDNIFLRDFGKSKNNLNQWPGYYHSLSARVKNLSAKYPIHNIGVVANVLKDKRMKAVCECVYLANTNKNPKVQKHDAYHILLIKSLRREEPITPIMGSKTWFVTDDSSLKSAEKKYADETKYSSTLQIEKILVILDEYEYISEFETASPSKVFGELIKSNIQVSAATIRVNDLIETASNWLDFNDLSNDEITEIFADRQFKHRLDTARKDNQETPKEVALSRIIGKLKDKQSTISQELENTKGESEDKSTRIQHLNDQIKSLEGELSNIKNAPKQELPIILPPTEEPNKDKPFEILITLVAVIFLVHVILGLVLSFASDWSTYEIIMLLLVTFGISGGAIVWLYKDKKL